MKKARWIFSALALVGLVGVVATSYTPPKNKGGPQVTAAVGEVPSCCASKGNAGSDHEATLVSAESGGCCSQSGGGALAEGEGCEKSGCAAEKAETALVSAESEGGCPYARQTAATLVSQEAKAGCGEACGGCPSAKAEGTLATQEKTCGEKCDACPLVKTAAGGCGEKCDDLPLPKQAALADGSEKCDGCPQERKTEATLASQTSEKTDEASAKACDTCPAATKSACNEKCCDECPASKKTAAKLASQESEQKACAGKQGECSEKKSCCPSKTEKKDQKQADQPAESGEKLAAE